MTNTETIKLLNVLASIGGFFGFLICCFVAFIATNPNGPALMVLRTLILMWVGGMIMVAVAMTEFSRAETETSEAA